MSDLIKRAARKRMAETGENYTTARRKVIEEHRMGLTTDPNDPDLGHGVDREPVSQHSKYLVLSEEERAKGFVRPVFRAYIHHDPECGAITTMGLELCETAARNPKFYGATYCCRCQMHRPVDEFTWVDAAGNDTGVVFGT